MTPLSVRFHDDRRETIFPDVDPGEAIDGTIVEAVVVANGVEDDDGRERPSVVIRIDTNEGPVAGLTTARLIVMVSRMILAKYPDLMEDAR
jgi:hypothetical protein